MSCDRPRQALTADEWYAWLCGLRENEEAWNRFADALNRLLAERARLGIRQW